MREDIRGKHNRRFLISIMHTQYPKTSYEHLSIWETWKRQNLGYSFDKTKNFQVLPNRYNRCTPPSIELKICMSTKYKLHPCG